MVLPPPFSPYSTPNSHLIPAPVRSWGLLQCRCSSSEHINTSQHLHILVGVWEPLEWQIVHVLRHQCNDNNSIVTSNTSTMLCQAHLQLQWCTIIDVNYYWCQPQNEEETWVVDICHILTLRQHTHTETLENCHTNVTPCERI